jgi:hypothetical protein
LLETAALQILALRFQLPSVVRVTAFQVELQKEGILPILIVTGRLDSRTNSYLW